jgi:hypothetical protein
MAASIYVGNSWRTQCPANPDEQSVWLDDTAIYWHLYRYFEAANLDRRHELVDLYGGGEIDGYQLDRLEDELLAARGDAAHRPSQWKVPTGWNDSPSRENEIWRAVEKSELLVTIDKLLALIDFARTNHLKPIVSGD